jgi:hypothetical protein
MQTRTWHPERGAYERIARKLHGKDTRPIRIARWCMDYEQKRMRLFRGHGPKSKTRAGCKWRLFWRIKKQGRRGMGVRVEREG